MMTDISKKTILLVEDEAIIAMSGARTLEKHGYAVLIAHSGEQAIKTAHANTSIDLILMDIDLGKGMDGTRAAEEILKARDIPVLFLSNHTEPEIVDRTERITSYGYVVKNSGETVLLASIRMAFRLENAHRELKKHDELFSDIAAFLPETIFETDMNGRVTFVNQVALERFGYTTEEFERGVMMLDMVVPEDRERTIRNVERVMRGEQLGLIEYTIQRKDGSTFPGLAHANPVLRNGRPVGLSGFLVDITDRKHAEEELSRSEERFSKVFNSSLVPIIVTDIDSGLIIDINEQCVKMIGYTREELIGRTTSELGIVADWENRKRIIAELKQKGSVRDMPFQLVTRSGEVLDVLWSLEVIKLGYRDVMLSTIYDFTASKKAEKAMRESETRYRNVIQNIPMGVHLYVLEPDGRLVFEAANPAADRILGVDNSMFISKTIEEAFPGLASTEVPLRYREVAEKGIPWQTEQVDYDDNFIRGAFEVHAFRVGERRMAAVFTDITGRKRSEAALRESEERWHFALEGAGDGIFDWNVQTNRVYLSPHWKSILGYGENELCDTLDEWESHIHPDDREQVFSELRKHRKGMTEGYVSEHRVRHKNGEYLWVLARGRIISRDPEGKPLRMIGMYTDITRRRMTEERYTTFLKAAIDGFVVFTAEGKFLEVNDTYMRMIGYSREEILGMGIIDVEANFSAEEVLSRLKDIVDAKSARFETRHRHKDGHIIDVEVSVSVLEHEGGRLFVFIRDITSQKLTAAALENSLREKDALFHELQHRMKNSLAMIKSLISLDMDRPENLAARGALQSLRGRIDSLASLYAFLSGSDNAAIVSLDEYIHLVTTSLAATYVAGPGAVTIERSFDRITSNPKNATAWGLIANELLTNALKYAFPRGGPGTIRIALSGNDGMIALTVSDSGGGPPANFDIDRPTGLGLLLVKMLADQLGGALMFERGAENVFAVRAPLSSSI